MRPLLCFSRFFFLCFLLICFLPFPGTTDTTLRLSLSTLRAADGQFFVCLFYCVTLLSLSLSFTFTIMSSIATVPSSNASHVSPTELVTEKKTFYARFVTAVQGLEKALYNTRVQLLRKRRGMQELLSRCEVFGSAVECCADALASLPTSPDTSFNSAASSVASLDKSSTAAASLSYRQLYWSLSQFHTHVAQLLSAASLRAYDAAVTSKIVNRLSLMERGAATLLQSAAGAARGGDDTAVLQGCARELEQLACTRFAPAYEAFLLYTVATLGDFCALWDTAVQKSAEEVVWSSGQEDRSPMVTPLHSEQTSADSSRLNSLTTSDKKVKKSPQLGPVKALSAEPKKRRVSSSTLGACFGTAIAAVEDLRDALFNYVGLLHETAHQFSVVAVSLTSTFAMVRLGTMSHKLDGCLDDIAQLDYTLANSSTRRTTHRLCYEAIINDGVLRSLRQLQDDSKKGIRLGVFFDAMKYPLMEKASTVLEQALCRLKEQHRKDGTSYHPSRTSSTICVPSSPMEVLFDVWHKTADLCVQIGTEISAEFTQRVSV